MIDSKPTGGWQPVDEIRRTLVPMYFCPSRRGPTRWSNPAKPPGSEERYWLIDYAGVTPGKLDLVMAVEFPDPNNKNIQKPVIPQRLTNSKDYDFFEFRGDFFGWNARDRCRAGGDSCVYRFPVSGDPRNMRLEFHGIIVRTDFSLDVSPPRPLGNTPPTKFPHITDGASKTLMVSEKAVPPWSYEAGGYGADDCGWGDGWDYDTMRAAWYPIGRDIHELEYFNQTGQDMGYSLGSAHSFGIHGLFGDGSVRSITYDISRLMLNRLGNRDDGESVDEASL
jgi:hypothetical protein